MTHLSWNPSADARTSGDVRWAVALSLLLLLRVGPASPDGMAGERPAAAGRDIEVELRVRRALLADPQLRNLNLYVRIADGIVELAGPVPSSQLKQRAVWIAERVEGVLKVRARELYVTRSAEVPRPVFVRVDDDRPAHVRSASLPLTPTPLPSGERGEERLPSPRWGEGLGVRGPARPAEPARLTAQPRPKQTVAFTVSDLDRLRHGDSRFQYLRTQVQGATVYVFPGETALEDVMRFAQVVRRLPGVQHVVVAPGSR
jgi:hypothetical protein